MKKTKKVILVTLLFFAVFLPSINADTVSINSGGSQDVWITPNKYIEGIFPEEPSSDDGGSGGGSGGGGGGGSTSEEPEENETENETAETFELDQSEIEVTMRPEEETERCFTATNPTEEAIFNIDVNKNGEIIEFIETSPNNFNLMPELSQEICTTFSSGNESTIGNHTGNIEVTKNETKTVDLMLQINNQTEVNQTEEEDDSRGIGADYVGNRSGEGLEDALNDLADRIPDPLKDVRTLILWIPLLLAVMIFLIIKKYSQFMQEISNRKTREEKVAEAEKMQREAQRSDRNIFEKIIDKTAMKMAKGSIKK